MTPKPEDRRQAPDIHEDLQSIKGMYKTLIAILLGTVITGFGFFYIMHGRVSVLEYANNQGGRFTTEQFNVFKTQYEKDEMMDDRRIVALEKATQSIGKNVAEINININHLLELYSKGK